MPPNESCGLIRYSNKDLNEERPLMRPFSCKTVAPKGRSYSSGLRLQIILQSDLAMIAGQVWDTSVIMKLKPSERFTINGIGLPYGECN